jgi:hypothetical protein
LERRGGFCSFFGTRGKKPPKSEVQWGFGLKSF